ncbi:class II aldolase/adducin family protein [Dongia sedimenti]|uniref:Class II aldolase/adducin family protein n=1 Tax=Dongia sedimenti TaxID=3064282 RepID=A0ABU0YPY0_9PROT|nr:class II aldolase/adducin family protein [Rhodospirillaceae bacterium R-7]
MNVCSSGNISVRRSNGMLITPASSRVETFRSEHVVFVDAERRWTGQFRPSSEAAMHQAVYESVPDAHAVIHTHADFCVALASCRKPIPPFHYMVHGFGGMDVPCVEYQPFGSSALAEAAGKALIDRNACLLANHGMLARGTSLSQAFETALKLEALARQFVLASSVGSPVLLTAVEWETVRQQYRTYGNGSLARRSAGGMCLR